MQKKKLLTRVYGTMKYRISEEDSQVKVDMNISYWKTFLYLLATRLVTRNDGKREEKKESEKKGRIWWRTRCIPQNIAIPSMAWSNWESLCNARNEIFLFLFPTVKHETIYTDVPYRNAFFFTYAAFNHLRGHSLSSLFTSLSFSLRLSLSLPFFFSLAIIPIRI